MENTEVYTVDTPLTPLADALLSTLEQADPDAARALAASDPGADLSPSDGPQEDMRLRTPVESAVRPVLVAVFVPSDIRICVFVADKRSGPLILLPVEIPAEAIANGCMISA